MNQGTILRVEDRKIGYTSLLLGIVALISAWTSILRHQVNTTEIVFLVLGLIAALSGIALILRCMQTGPNTLNANEGQLPVQKPERASGDSN